MVIVRSAFLLWSFLLLSASAFSQLPGPTPSPTPRPGSRAAAAPAVARDKGAYERLDAIEAMTDKSVVLRHPVLDKKNGIYRKPSEEETAVLAVSRPVLEEYGSFLRSEDSGIVKLNGDSSCFSGSDVVVLNEKCAPFKMPGAGTSFSFRTASYRLPRLADVILFNGTFRADAVLQLVTMVELGDVPIGSVSIGSAGLKYLVDLEPPRDGDKFLKFDEELTRGINADGFFYRKGHTVKPNTTYALRSIAYRGNFFRTVDRVTYDELNYDRRRDVIVVFRVVEYEETGNPTIAWKRLKDVEAPKLNIKK